MWRCRAARRYRPRFLRARPRAAHASTCRPALDDHASAGHARRSRSRSALWERAGVKATRPAAVLDPGRRPARARRCCSRCAPSCRAIPARSPFPAARSIRTTRRPAAAALREAEEEIGLARGLIEPIGYLDLYLTFSGFRILPTVARVRPGLSARAQRREVADAFEVPLAFLMERRTTRCTAATGRASSAILRDAVRRALHLGRDRRDPAQPVRTDLSRRVGRRPPCGFARSPRRRESGYDAAMIRPVLTELALFLAPFVVYAIFLWATRAGVLDPESWPLPAHRLADDRGARPDDRQLHRARAMGRRAAGLDLCAGPYRGRQVRAG